MYYEHIIAYYMMLEDMALIRGDFVAWYRLADITMLYCIMQDGTAPEEFMRAQVARLIA